MRREKAVRRNAKRKTTEKPDHLLGLDPTVACALGNEGVRSPSDNAVRYRLCGIELQGWRGMVNII